MSEHDEKRGGAGCVIGLVLVILLLPVLYVLSIGPISWLMNRQLIVPASVGRFYWPITYLCQNWAPSGKVIGWWQDLI